MSAAQTEQLALARLIGAQLSIDSSPGNGTRVGLRVSRPA
jgi:hypothetical protein